MSPDQIFIEVNGRPRSIAWLIENANAATDVRVYNCPGLTIINAGKDGRNYDFRGVHVKNRGWFVQAGCRFLSIPDALKHRGPDSSRHRADCLALVNKIIDQSAEFDAAQKQAAA
jgi:hypothetical protein